MSAKADTAIDVLMHEINELTKLKDNAYAERDKLVAALSKCFPSYLAKHPDNPDWEPDWMWIVFIDTPEGQCSWHIHDSELGMFSHLTVKENNWDGHSTDEKYERLAKLYGRLYQ